MSLCRIMIPMHLGSWIAPVLNINVMTDSLLQEALNILTQNLYCNYFVIIEISPAMSTASVWVVWNTNS